MRNTRLILLSTALAGLLGSAAGPGGAQPVPPPPPGLPAPHMSDLHVRVVPNAPPQRRHEVRIGRAQPGHVWVGGFWHHTGQEWTWNDGRWAERPSRHARWIAPRYQRVRGGYRYIPGHWSNQRVIYR